MSNFDTWAEDYTKFQRAIYNTAPQINRQPSAPAIDYSSIITALQEEINSLKLKLEELQKPQEVTKKPRKTNK